MSISDEPLLEQATSDEALLLGRVMGPFRIQRFVARGGMGSVFEAIHMSTGERVAVKVLASGQRPGLTASRHKRFITETRALQRLSHPSLVRILDCGETEGGLPWFAMEFLDGESLRLRMERHVRNGSHLPAHEIVSIARQIAHAMAVIHAMGVVHRDLKPDNIMIVRGPEAQDEECVKVVDFGVAKLLDAEAGVTTEGVTLGTATYMAPEQCVGNALIDGSADVYSLGVILYELIAGEPPFRGDVATVMRQHIFAVPASLQSRASLAPAGLVELIEALLLKEPSRRPAIEDVIDALESTPIALKQQHAMASMGVVTDERIPTIAAEATGDRIPIGHTTAEQIETIAAPIAQPRTSHRRWMSFGAGAVALLGVVAMVSLRLNALKSTPETPILPGMVRIQGGKYQMGSSAEEIEQACQTLHGGCTDAEMPQLTREKPLHEVQISSFQIDIDEVDNRSFAIFLNTLGPEIDTREDRDEHRPRFVTERASGLLLVDLHPRASGIERNPDGTFAARAGRERLPAVQISWDGASRYCRYVGKRLPTEAEWEFAARGKERRMFPWGDAPPRCDGVAFGRGEARGCKDKPPELDPVGTGSQDITPEGVRGLGGNAGEWVQDQFLLPYYEACGDCKDPVVDKPVSGTDDFRIFRGGTFLGIAWLSRGSTRSRWRRTNVMDGIGVRCASR